MSEPKTYLGRELSLAEQALLIEIQLLERKVNDLALGMESRRDVVKRDLAVARTNLQTGFLWLNNAVIKPVGA